jgi:hypothetical protein
MILRKLLEQIKGAVATIRITEGVVWVIPEVRGGENDPQPLSFVQYISFYSLSIYGMEQVMRQARTCRTISHLPLCLSQKHMGYRMEIGNSRFGYG